MAYLFFAQDKKAPLPENIIGHWSGVSLVVPSVEGGKSADGRVQKNGLGLTGGGIYLVG